MSRLMASLRLVRASYVLAREGVLSALPLKDIGGFPVVMQKFSALIARPVSRDQSDSARKKRATRLSRAVHRLGPSYVKLGQFLATRPDIVGQEVARDLSLLQDRVEPFPQQAAIHQIEETLHQPIDKLFLELGEPVAAASMAQVHEAYIETLDGQRVKRAAKVMRPNLRRAFARDLESFYLAAHSVEKHIPETRRLRPVSVVENLEQTTHLEMDMRLEAAALSEMAENIAKHDDKGFRVPQVDWDRTGRDCLTMEWIDGIKMSDREALIKKGHNVEQLAATLMQSFLSHALRDGFFHADMHPGNLFVDDAGMIVAVDFGITGRLGKKEKRFLAEILYGFIKRDYMRVAKVHFEAGYVPAHHSVESFAQANRAIGEPIYGQSVETISMARLLGLLFEVTELFDMQTRPELLLLQKSMVVVEGVARSLDPHFNMWKVAEPVVSKWVAYNLGVIGASKDLADSGEALLGFARRLPTILDRHDKTSQAMAEQAEHGFRLDKESLQILASYQAKTNRALAWGVWVIAICLVVFLWFYISH